MTVYIEVLKSRLSRYKTKFKDLEKLVHANAASPHQKHEYADLKARIDELEYNIELAEGLMKEEE